MCLTFRRATAGGVSSGRCCGEVPAVRGAWYVASPPRQVWHLAGLPRAVPVNFLLSAGLAAAVAFAYRLSLNPLRRLLQRRERKILSLVSTEVE